MIAHHCVIYRFRLFIDKITVFYQLYYEFIRPAATAAADAAAAAAAAAAAVAAAVAADAVVDDFTGVTSLAFSFAFISIFSISTSLYKLITSSIVLSNFDHCPVFDFSSLGSIRFCSSDAGINSSA